MPNNNPTFLTISGDNITLDQFMNNVKGDSVLDFNTLYPIPEDENWFTWCMKNWGTKWNAYEVEEWTRVSNCMWTLRYKTAWYHASAFYLYVSKQYPTIVFKQEYADEGGI